MPLPGGRELCIDWPKAGILVTTVKRSQTAELRERDIRLLFSTFGFIDFGS